MKLSKGRHFAIMIFTIAILLVTSNAMADTYLLQDNFNSENGTVGVLNYTGFANWNVTRGTVDLIGNGFFDFLPGNGLYVDLDGSTSAAGRLESRSAFVLTPGVYALEFDLAGSQRGGSPSDTVIVSVILGNLVNATITLPYTQPFTEYEYYFTVSQTRSATIVFDHSGNDNMGLLLDNVELRQVPEPTSMLLLAFGLIGLVGLRRKF